jgi:glycosyltransferase involved in cell wall biosynthesis
VEVPPRRPSVTVVANDVGPVGGMQVQLSRLISGLLDSGHEVTVISWTCDLPPHPALRWVRVPGPSRPFAIAFPVFLGLGSLLVGLRSRGVVHSTGAIVLNRVQICTVHFCHMAVAELPAPSRASRPRFPYRLNATIGSAFSRLAERWCYRPERTARLVGVSNGVAAELRRHFPRMSGRVSVIPNGVDSERFRPDQDAVTADRSETQPGLRALFVGSEWARKGLDLAIAGLVGNPAVTLTVVGEGDVGTYRGLARRLGVAERVHFAGGSTDVAPWYRQADVFLLPTSYEAAPLVAYEAAASGLPLLMTRVNGVEELIRDGANGWFIEREPGDIRRRLEALALDPELRAAMGRQARRDSLECSWSCVVEGYERLYAEIAA